MASGWPTVANLAGLLWQGGRDLLFPPWCPACGTPMACGTSAPLCPACLETVSWLTPPLCPCCGRPHAEGRDRLCGVCLQRAPIYDRVRSLFVYEGPIRSLILAWKFQGRQDAFRALCGLVRARPPETELSEPDLILPVPLHISRLRSRGFNQALQLCHYAFPHWRARIHSQGLIRTRPTTPQAGLDGAARRRNLRGAFALHPRLSIQGRSVLLVDDVFTTGTTMTECCQVLEGAGAARLELWSLARVADW